MLHLAEIVVGFCHLFASWFGRLQAVPYDSINIILHKWKIIFFADTFLHMSLPHRADSLG